MLRDIAELRHLKIDTRAATELTRLLDEANQLVAITVASRKTRAEIPSVRNFEIRNSTSNFSSGIRHVPDRYEIDPCTGLAFTTKEYVSPRRTSIGAIPRIALPPDPGAAAWISVPARCEVALVDVPFGKRARIPHRSSTAIGILIPKHRRMLYPDAPPSARLLA